MAANFNDAAINGVFNSIVSYCMATGRFDQVNQHEPKSAPGTGIFCSIWINQIRPIEASGLAATSGVVELQARIYTSFAQQPFDMIDPNVTSATLDIMGALSGDFNFQGTNDVRNVDLLGAYIAGGLRSQAGYVEIDRQIYRVMTIFIPIVINDMFIQVA